MIATNVATWTGYRDTYQHEGYPWSISPIGDMLTLDAHLLVCLAALGELLDDELDTKHATIQSFNKQKGTNNVY